MNTEEYINSIEYKGDLSPTIELLKELQKRHLYSIPFENLDIHYGNTIELDLNKLYKKIVLNKRGGFCYELNALFCSLLSDLGFETKMISARVYEQEKGIYSPEYDHMAIVVSIANEDYLVDVGFGDFTVHPLKIELGVIQSDPSGNYSIEKEKDEYFVSKLNGEKKDPEYKFTLKGRLLSVFASRCHFHQTSEESHFTKKKIITRLSDQGRITLAGNKLKISKNGIQIFQSDLEDDEYPKQLFRWFGCKLK